MKGTKGFSDPNRASPGRLVHGGVGWICAFCFEPGKESESGSVLRGNTNGFLLEVTCCAAGDLSAPLGHPNAQEQRGVCRMPWHSVSPCLSFFLSPLFLFQALSGPHYYTWGDHGGILVAIAQGTETDQLK